MTMQRRLRQCSAVLALGLACAANARAEDPAPAPGASNAAPTAVRQVGGGRSAKVEANRAGGAGVKTPPGMRERMEKFRELRAASRPGAPPEGRVALSRAAEPEEQGDEGAGDRLDPEQRRERRLERGKRARHMYWRTMMARVRRPSEIPPDVRNELRHHGRRIARLERIKELAQEKRDGKAVARVDELIAREQQRHESHMQRHLGALAPASAVEGKPAAVPEAKPAADPDPEPEATGEDEEGDEP